MKTNFIKNISRIRKDIRKYVKQIWGLNLLWKVMILLILFSMLPVLQFGLTAVVPLVGTLLFVKDDFKGRKRGLLAFALGTVSQLIIIVMIFSLLVISDIEGALGLVTILSATVSGMFMLTPGYALAFLFYGLDYKEPDGKIYMIMFVALGIIFGIWNTLAVRLL